MSQEILTWAIDQMFPRGAVRNIVIGESIDYGMTRPANKLRASKESTLKGTQTKSEPGLAGFPY